ncbi:DNA polymerase III subunit beta (plasmid) [Rossellomorea sp. AcN35-11]|nr:DNA polymerase III subunit beta [Rossellomorea aquimaris]WJV32308.1 DNA polymerase III subunit beta [Rossellomorea sp. AcN35-11]
MKFLIKKDALVEVYGDVSKAIASKNTIPALNTVKMVVSEKEVTLTGSNSDISIEATIPTEKDGEEIVSVKKTGSVCVNAKIFGDIIKKLPTDMATITVKDNFKTTIESNGTRFNLNGLDADEYPQLPSVNATDGSVYKIKSKALKTLIKKSIFAASTSESRPILTGANWNIKEGTLTSSVTDSHRLVKLPVEIGGDAESNVTIPGSSLKELEKILLDDESQVKVIITGNQVLFELDNILFYSRQLEGSFPDVSRLIPDEHQTQVTIKIKDLKASVDRASVLTRDKTNVVKIESKDGLLVISSDNPEIGTIEDEVKCQIEGEELKLSASAKYIMDMLNALDGDDVVINFNGAMKPFIANEKDNNNIVHLILPVRTY